MKLTEEQFSFVDKAISYLTKSTANLGFSFIAGYCSAYFVERIFRVAAFITGGFFLTLQIMAYNDLITINWHKFKPQKIDLTKLLRVISVSSGGFGLGFYVGIRREIHKLYI